MKCNIEKIQLGSVNSSVFVNHRAYGEGPMAGDLLLIGGIAKIITRVECHDADRSVVWVRGHVPTDETQCEIRTRHGTEEPFSPRPVSAEPSHKKRYSHYTYLSGPDGMRVPEQLTSLEGMCPEARRLLIENMMEKGRLVAAVPFGVKVSTLAELRKALDWLRENPKKRAADA